MSGKLKKSYTSKQMGDACEMLVAAELTLAGVPALKVPDNWPGYDIVAQPLNGNIQRISVKSRTYKLGAAYVIYNSNDSFDWLAIVLLNYPDETCNNRRVYIIPWSVADKEARKNKPGTKTENNRYWTLSEIDKIFAKYRDNFSLKN